MAKTGEQQAKTFMNHLFKGIYDRIPFSYKFRDKSYCIVCNTIQPKNEQSPDYVLGLLWDWLEVKGPHKSWNFVTGEPITDVQREKLSENFGWLFIELGEGRRPKGIQAFLIPWVVWIDTEKTLLEQKQKSLPLHDTIHLHGAIEIFPEFRLEWYDGHWRIPYRHVYWSYLKRRLERLLQGVNEWQKT